MAKPIIIPLNTTPEQSAKLRALQLVFSQVCNTLAPVVRDTRCWNRVALHHMTYRDLRAKFPQLGSQMVCNAIYSVSRTSRLLFQSPGSPFNIARLGAKPLPLMQFAPTAPVYFDRHTLSIKEGHLSMFTMDGRMRFELGLSPDNERRFHDEKLQEIVLSSRSDRFSLKFELMPVGEEAGLLAQTAAQTSARSGSEPEAPIPLNRASPQRNPALPDYLVVLPSPAPLTGDTP